VRKFIAILTATAAAVSLAGCAGLQPATLESDVAAIKPTCEHYSSNAGDDASKLSLVKNTTGAPTVKINGKLDGKTITTQVFEQGKGIQFTGDQLVNMEYIGLNGGNGKVFQSSKFDGSDMAAQYVKADMGLDFCHALSGVTEGSTVGIVVPAVIAHGGKGIADLKIGPTDAVVFVFKLAKIYLPRAIGAEQPQQSGFPSVVRAPSGQPGITMLKTDAPTTQQTAVLIKGHGAVVKAGQSVTVHYTGAVWGSKTVFDSSWSNGQPAQFQLKKGSVIDGFVDGIAGQTIGSQIITVIPPDKGYGSNAQSTIPANSTLVFVVDILGVND